MSNCLKLTALLSALLAGCALGPDYSRPDIKLPSQYSRAEDQAHDVSPITNNWWTLYNDPILNDLIETALRQNSDIRLAVARIEEADANLRVAGAAFLPEIDLDANATRSRVSTLTATPTQAGTPIIRQNLRLAASTSFELDFWGKLRRATEAARALALESRYAKDVVAMTLASTTAQAYFSLRGLEAQVIVTKETLTSREESLSLVRDREKAGVASSLEVNQAIGLRAEASAQLKDLQRQRALIEHQLGTLTGNLDIELSRGDLRTLPIPPLPPVGVPSDLLERRPDIKRAEQDLISANAQIGVAKASMFPTISLTGLFGGESQSLDNLLKSGGRIWTAGFGLSLPLFDAGRNLARTDVAIARQHQALANYQKVIETAFREVRDALTNVRQTRESESDLEESATAARNAVELAKTRYKAGYSSYLEVLDAQRTSNSAELALLRNRQARLSSSVDLIKVLGGGWQDNVGSK
jgi:multidrug efflux system outer membrane protein